MDKGIRPFCNALFMSTLPTRVNSREGNTAFRKAIIAKCMEEFSITLASAATHYNHAFIAARELAKTDETVAAQLEGLGRPEDKKGGRKPKPKAEAAPVATDAPTMRDVVLSNILNAIPSVVNNGDEMTGTDETPEGVQEEAAQELVVEAAPVVKFVVRKVSDGTVVCEDLSEDEADALIAKAAAAKKAKLEKVAA